MQWYHSVMGRLEQVPDTMQRYKPACSAIEQLQVRGGERERERGGGGRERERNNVFHLPLRLSSQKPYKPNHLEQNYKPTLSSLWTRNRRNCSQSWFSSTEVIWSV